MSPSLSSALAEFSAGLHYEDLPAPVRRAAQWHLVDTIGVAIAGADPAETTGAALGKLARQWRSDAGATVLGAGETARPESAALLNGSLAQALEMDDKHGSSLARPGSTVTPAVLAVAQDRGQRLDEVLTAMAAGYETMIRLGFVAGKRFLARGYHTSSLIGGFGSVAAIGRLTGLDAPHIADAFGIAGTFASGIQESTRTGSTSKILHGGWGAHAGIVATDLAAAGITGPSTVFEGDFGFFHTHLTPIEDELDWRTPADGLGTRWHLPDTAIKPYPCCQLMHSFIAGVKELLVEFAAAGITHADIDKVTCLLAEPGLTLVTQPADRKTHPQEPHEARFSLPYVVASALVRGDVGLSTFRVPALSDPAVGALADKIVTAEDPDSDYPKHCPAVIEVKAGDRTFTKRVPYHPGCAEAPLADDDVLTKFERNTTWLLGAQSRKVGAELAALPWDTPVAELIAMVEVAR
ncbi:MmgE/PrpD family protein [Amycolatopsis sp. NPDC051903]|uniref:MmgE/PrpD family protein n=1 Tax=Amycolatopsis sp. NPDC051903 TaxID=3363936 RepID=UPI0037999DD8